MTAVHFRIRFLALLGFVIKGKDEPFCEVIDVFYRVELQNRGSAHNHIFFWIDGGPKTVTAENPRYYN